MFHRSVSWTSAKMTTVSENVKSIFSLIEKNARGRVSNLQAQKIFQRTKIFNAEALPKKIFEMADVGGIIAYQKNVVNIDKDKGKRRAFIMIEKRIINLRLVDPSNQEDRRSFENQLREVCLRP